MSGHATFTSPQWHVIWCVSCSDLIEGTILLRVYGNSFPGISTGHDFKVDFLIFWYFQPFQPIIPFHADIYLE